MTLPPAVTQYRECPACRQPLPWFVRWTPSLSCCPCQRPGESLGPVVWIALGMAFGMLGMGRILDALGLRARWFDRLAARLAMSNLRKPRDP